MSEYRIWECLVCGWIYDESKGWPDDGIPPGTRWEDIPDDWSCPECGVGKEDFEMIEVRSAATDTKPAAPAAAKTASTAAETTPFRTWECTVCGWVYDEAEGWPDDGIAPGTRWEDIPDDWTCPECGVAKQDFQMVPLDSGAVIASKPAAGAPIVIVGSGLAGYNLARDIRKLDSATPITMITGDDGSFYSKPMLSTALAQGRTPEQLANANADRMASDLHMEIRTFTRVTAIDRSGRKLSLETASGTEQLQYGKLVLAWGADCIKPPMDVQAPARVFHVNDLTDYSLFRAALKPAARVLVIGAGLIGSEFANDLIQSGHAVQVVDPQSTPVASLLPPEAGQDLQQTLGAAGVEFHLGTVVERIEHADSGVRAHLDTGAVIEADIVLSAVGVRPRTELAASAGLRVNRGISVDRHLRTSDPDIFALGDCAEVDGHVLYYVAPLVACARALARTLCGHPVEVHYDAMPVAIKTTLRPTVVLPPPRGASGQWQVQAGDDGVHAEFRDTSGKLLGFALTGAAVAAREALTREAPALFD
ncbi:FAD-dependent oxidoreductase [Biformimicrobium ophioploci]|uniref:Rubredoxin-like domain-containing protein n=1 Tax=Biformimicrobium ophioploci TaxID=3036711 RepID=A0ABQ6LWP3_9GAMM|nr:FAD-dependent oxidoreductase [Microbulbifer sp. NKW57]GMG86479.1 hypothetical protein MNKW57_08000 [Microbulbifer sp. NKW57]